MLNLELSDLTSYLTRIFFLVGGREPPPAVFRLGSQGLSWQCLGGEIMKFGGSSMNLLHVKHLVQAPFELSLWTDLLNRI